MMNYIGIDGNVHSDELKHWKYIKKIKSGSGWRYFYTPEEVRAYSASTNKVSPEYREELAYNSQKNNFSKPIKEKQIKEKKIKEKKIHERKVSPEYREELAYNSQKNNFSKPIKEKKIRYSPKDAYSEEKRKRENKYAEARKPSVKNIKKEVKETWQYAKPQKPSTMLKKNRKDDKKEQDRWLNERDRITRSNAKVNKGGTTFDYKTARSYARNHADWEENERKHKERKKKNADRAYNAQRYRDVVSKPARTINSAKNKATKGKAKVKKVIKSEVAGTKRVLNATRGKGNNSYSVDGKTYNKYDRKKQRLGKKKYKTSKLERAILKGYRATHPYE